MRLLGNRLIIRKVVIKKVIIIKVIILLSNSRVIGEGGVKGLKLVIILSYILSYKY